MNAKKMLYNEIENIIERYGKESDITFWDVIAVLEVTKADYLDILKKINTSENEM